MDKTYIMHTIITFLNQINFFHIYILKSYPQNVDKLLITFVSHVKILNTPIVKALFFAYFDLCLKSVFYINIYVCNFDAFVYNLGFTCWF